MKQEEIENNGANYSNVSDNNLGSLCITYNASQECSSGKWFLDSGCNNHMTRNKDFFASLDDSVKYEVKLGNDNKVFVMGKGFINVLTKNGGKGYIPNVNFVLGLKHNLMSVGQLVQKGYKVCFDNDVCTILDRNIGGKLIARVNMTQN